MTQIIPLQATPNQTLTISLANQACQIDLLTKTTGLYMNLYVNNSPIILGVACENRNRIVRDLYLGFSGDLVFNDKQGSDDPVYTGLGSRFDLVYIEADELPAGVG